MTGGENAYEIVREGSGYAAHELFAGSCNFTGIAIRADHLYTTCLGEVAGASGMSHLLAAPLTAEVELEVIHDFSQVGFPNGIAFDDAGRLYVADFTPLLGKVVTLSFAADAPLEVRGEAVFHSMNHRSPTGSRSTKTRSIFPISRSSRSSPSWPTARRGLSRCWRGAWA